MIAQVLWQSPELGPAAMGLVALLAATVVWLYPPQTRGVPRRWRWAMPTLRGLAVAALAAAVAQPIVLRPRSKSRQGAVLVLIDRSHSMSVVDRQRTPAELVSLAAGLGVLPANARSEASGGVRGRLEHVRALDEQLLRARSEAEYARISGRGLAAAAARVRDATEQLRAALAEMPVEKSQTELAARVAEIKQIPPALDEAAVRALGVALDAATKALTSAQTQEDEKLFEGNAVVRSICTALREQSRAQLLETGLSQPNGMLANLPAGTPISLFAFADSVAPLEWTPGAPIELDIGGTRTDIGGALRDALARMSGKPIQAIVLLSDGRQVGGDVEALASDVSSSGVPVFAVQTAAASSASGTQPQDVSIVNVSAPRGARIGQTIAVRADLRAPALRGSSIDVRLDAESIRLAKRVAIDEEGSGVAEFQLQLSRAGPASLVVSVPPSPGESSDENNRFERSIRVGADAARVLVIAGDGAGKQLDALTAALSRAPWLELEVMSQTDATGLTPRTISAQDVVILCDFPPAALSEAQWSALDDLMRQRGGSVIVCAGQHAFDYPQHPSAKNLVPTDTAVGRPAWRSWPGDEPQFRIVPAAGVELESADLEAWRQLAGVSRYIPLAPFREGADARAILVERESSAPVLTESRIGLGHAYVVSTDQSWRWRTTGLGGEEKDLFWTQLVRLAAGDPYAAVEGNAALDADDVTPEPEEPFTVRARMLDSSGQPVQVPNLPLRIFRGETDASPVREVTLGSLQNGSGRYEANVSGLPVGRYTLHVDPPEDPTLESRAEPVTLGITVAPHLESEMADLSGDERLLKRIADASGGQFLSFDQFNALPRRLAENREKLNPLVEYTLWDSPYLYGFVLACLSAEWALRKKFGLA